MNRRRAKKNEKMKENIEIKRMEGKVERNGSEREERNGSEREEWNGSEREKWK